MYEVTDGQQQSGQEDQLISLSHDLMNCFNAVYLAAYFLDMKQLSKVEREQYMDVLNRNLTQAESMLDVLLEVFHRHDLTALLRRLQAQLPTVVPIKYRERINQCRQTVNDLLDPKTR